MRPGQVNRTKRLMQTYDASAVAAALPYGQLVDVLDSAFRSQVTVPVRTNHTVPKTNASDANLLLMPAWREGGMLGVKIVTVFPDNAQRGLGAVNASYVLMHGETGVPVAMLDGDELTLRRTACASALASRYLSRDDSSTLLMIGTGRLAPHLVAAHAAVRPIKRVVIWGRRQEAAQSLVEQIAPRVDDVRAANNLSAEIDEADIISCATLASTPLIRGELLRPGQHLDLVGAFTPSMAEADPTAMQRARVFVDTYDGALAEAGDILQALDTGTIERADVLGEMAELSSGAVVGRLSREDITLFKSVGTALEDLAAAELVAAGA